MQKILTVILDGWGYREEEYGNAIKMADTKNFDKLWETYPHTTLYASEEYVGLNPGEFGNSEIGHMTIGAGRKILQHGPQITEFFKKEEDNPKFQEFLNEAKNKTVHIIGLYSDGKVHSNLEHFLSMYNILKNNNAKQIHFHLITDGRDTKVTAGVNYIKNLEEIIKEDANADISSICGRYYAMDRDNNYERTKIYYDLLTKGIGINTKSATDGILSLYKKNITDEFLYPIMINPESTIKDGDIILWMNYRSDRAKQILKTFTYDKFAEFPVYKYNDLKVYSFVPVIDKDVKTINFLEDIKVTNSLGRYLSTLDLTQSRIAETEKYAHVTFFFDGMYNGKIEKCDKVLVPSPKVETYDLQPEMSATEVTKKTINAMEKDVDFILVNFANPDMVGHTGNLDATMKAVTTVDVCLQRLYEVAQDNFYTMIILADHGNADIMLDEFNAPVTTHTTSKVPFIITDNNIELKKSGDLTNVAPTILEYMDIALPEEMQNTKSLII